MFNTAEESKQLNVPNFYKGMRHAKIEDLTDICPLLNEIRNMENIREKQPSHFYFRGKNVVHFHATDNEIFVDIGNSRMKIQIPIDAFQIEKIKTKIKEYMGDISSARKVT